MSRPAHLLLVSLLSLFALTFSACGDSGSSSNDGADSVDPDITVNITTDVAGEKVDTKQTPQCKGSLIQDSYKQYDHECDGVSTGCKVMPTPQPFMGCFCLVCGKLGVDDKCFFVCCQEECNPFSYQ